MNTREVAKGGSWQELALSKFATEQQHQEQPTMTSENSSEFTSTMEYLALPLTFLDSSMGSARSFLDWCSTFADPRVDDWPLMSSSLPPLGIFFAYLLLSNVGPSLMKSRKALQLRLALVVYNLYIALLNLWIASELFYCAYKLKYYRSMCQLVRPQSRDEYELRIANVVWWYFASKGFEFADTMFFVLRKKDKQLTFLHKYHHSTMFLIWWTAARFVPGGSTIIPVFVNSCVHVLMYSYYGLAALGPAMAPYLWWKRHLTIVQLVQFVVGVSIGLYLIASGCAFTRWMQYVFSCYAFSFIVLFGNFYAHEYTQKPRSNLQPNLAPTSNGKVHEHPCHDAQPVTSSGASGANSKKLN